MPIDYERAKKNGPRLRAALTRATKQPEDKRYAAVTAACKIAITEWEAWGAWPDAWSRWQRALDDAAGWQRRAPRLEEL